MKFRTIAGVVILVMMSLLAGCFGAKMSEPDQALYDEATNLIRSDDKENFKQAEKILADLQAKYPEDVNIAIWRAQMMLAWGDSLKQEVKFIQTRRAKIDALGTQAKSDLESVKKWKNKDNAQTEIGKIDAKVQDMDQIIEKWKAESETYLKKGENIIMMFALEKDESHQSWRVLADFYRIRGNKEKAMQNLDMVGMLNNKSAGYRFIKGAIAMDMDKDYDTAIELFNDALELDPNFMKAKYYLGLAQDAKGDHDAATATMNEVLAASPNHLGAQTFLKMTDYLTEAKKHLEAVEAEQIIEDFPETEE